MSALARLPSCAWSCIIDAFRIASNGSLTAIGSVVVPGAAGGQGIAAS
jgi:hypothetical protein